MKIGMVGLGRMGSGIVQRLLRGGHETVVYDRSPAAIDALVAVGATGATGSTGATVTTGVVGTDSVSAVLVDVFLGILLYYI